MVLVFLGILLRFLFYGTGDLWTDEAFTALLTRRPVAEILRVTALDVHPPLFYLIVKGLLVVTGGASEWVLRLPSVLASCLTLLLAGKWFQKRLRPAGALVATALLALNPLWLFCAQEARMYAFSGLGAILIAHAYGRWQITRDRRWLVAVGVFEVLMLYNHYFAIFLIMGLNLHVLFKALTGEDLLRKEWGISQLLVGLAFTPWLLFALPVKMASGYVGNEWRLPITLLDSIPNTLGAGGIWLDGRYSFSGTHPLWWLPWSFMAMAAGVLGGRLDSDWREGMWVVFPPFFLCALMQPFTREIHWLARYLIVLTPWFYLLMGKATEALVSRVTPLIRTTLLGGAVVLALSGGIGYATGPRANFYRLLVRALPKDDASSLLVSFSDGWVLAYYLHETEQEERRPWLLLEPGNVFSSRELGWNLKRSRVRNDLGGPLGTDYKVALQALEEEQTSRTLWILMDKYTREHSVVARNFMRELAQTHQGSLVRIHSGDDHTLIRFVARTR
jgi:hypothetical protein